MSSGRNGQKERTTIVYSHNRARALCQTLLFYVHYLLQYQTWLAPSVLCRSGAGSGGGGGATSHYMPAQYTL